MKLIQTAIIFDRGEIAETVGWRSTYDAYAATIPEMVNPPGNDCFAIRKKTRKLDKNGRKTSQWSRNGVGRRGRRWQSETPGPMAGSGP